MPEHWEDELLLEADVLERLDTLFLIFTEELENILCHHEDDIDHKLAMCLAVILQESHIVHCKEIVLDNHRIAGIRSQLADVMDEIHVLQAGLPTKGGVKYEED